MNGQHQQPHPGQPPQGGPPRYAPHRGGVILALGILGLVTCFIFGIIAWVMAGGDLQKMAAGRMDPSGQGITEAGRILGIVATMINVLAYVMLIVFVLGTARW